MSDILDAIRIIKRAIREDELTIRILEREFNPGEMESVNLHKKGLGDALEIVQAVSRGETGKAELPYIYMVESMEKLLKEITAANVCSKGASAEGGSL